MRAALEAHSLRKMAAGWRDERVEAERAETAKRAEIRAHIAKATSTRKTAGETAGQRRRLDDLWVSHYSSGEYMRADIFDHHKAGPRSASPGPAAAQGTPPRPELAESPQVRVAAARAMKRLGSSPSLSRPGSALGSPGGRPGGSSSSSGGQRPGSAVRRPGSGQRPGSAAVGRRPGSAAAGRRPGSAAAGRRPGSAAPGQRPGSAAPGQRPGSARRPGSAAPGLGRRRPGSGAQKWQRPGSAFSSPARSRPGSALQAAQAAQPPQTPQTPQPAKREERPETDDLLERVPAARRLALSQNPHRALPEARRELPPQTPLIDVIRPGGRAPLGADHPQSIAERQARADVRRAEEEARQAERERLEAQMRAQMEAVEDAGASGAAQGEEPGPPPAAAAQQQQQKRLDPSLALTPLTLPARRANPFHHPHNQEHTRAAPGDPDRAPVTHLRRHAVAGAQHIEAVMRERFVDNQPEARGAPDERKLVLYKHGVRRDPGAPGVELPEPTRVPLEPAERETYFGRPALDAFFEAAREQRRALAERRGDEDADGPPTPRTAFIRKLLRSGTLPEPILVRRRLDNPALSLDHFGMSDALGEALAVCLPHLPHLESVSVADNRFTDRALGALMESAVNMNLKAINLSGNVLGDRTVAALGSQLEMTGTLHTLVLSNVRLRDRHLADAVDCLCSNTTVLELDVSQNELTSVGGEILARLLAATGTMTKLNASWNSITGNGAVQIADSIRHHRSLLHLDLGWNGFGPDAQHLAEALEDAESLTYLDLARNKVSSANAMLMAGVLQRNSTLRTLRLGGNPIGVVARRALFRALDWLHSPDLVVDLDNCSDDPDEPGLVFDSMHPAGVYTLDMAKPHERWAAMRVLHVVANKHECRLHKGRAVWTAGGGVKRNVDLVPSQQPGSQLRFMAEPAHPADEWPVPRQGELVLTVTYRRHRPQPREAEDGVALMRISTALRESMADDVAKLELLREYTADLRFYAQHLRHLVAPFVSIRTRMEALAALIPVVVNPEQLQPLIAALSPAERALLRKRVGPVFGFDMRNATNHYALDLSDPNARVIVVWLLELSHQLPAATSQHANGSLFRNATLNGEHIVVDNALFDRPLARGVLEFDFVSTERPDLGLRDPVDPDEFGSLLAWLVLRYRAAVDAAAHRRQADHQRPALKELLRELRDWLVDRYLVCEQAAVLMHALHPHEPPEPAAPPGIELPEGAAAKPPQQRLGGARGWKGLQKRIAVLPALAPPQARAQTNAYLSASIVVALFGRLLDVENVALVLHALPPAVRKDVRRRLGVLNLFSPLAPEGFHELDLALPDERGLARILVELAMCEPGVNWLAETYDDIPGWELPKSWAQEVPKRGLLTLHYFSGPGYGCYPNWDARMRLMDRVLASVRPGATLTVDTPWAHVYGWPAPEVAHDAGRGRVTINSGSGSGSGSIDLAGVASAASAAAGAPKPPSPALSSPSGVSASTSGPATPRSAAGSAPGTPGGGGARRRALFVNQKSTKNLGSPSPMVGGRELRV